MRIVLAQNMQAITIKDVIVYREGKDDHIGDAVCLHGCGFPGKVKYYSKFVKQ